MLIFTSLLLLLGSHEKGEIEIVKDPQKVEAIEKECCERLLKKGIPLTQAKEWSRTGVVAEDQYWMWVRDPVIFPSNSKGTYGRLIWKYAIDGGAGVAILPVMPNKKIALNLNFRHATRSWEIELPRGGAEKGETSEAVAKRELEEETGYLTDTLIFIGDMAPDSGVLESIIPVYYCLCKKRKETKQDEAEAIKKQIFLTKQQIKDAFVKGYIEVDGIHAYLRDPFLSFALLQAECRGLL